METSFTLPKLLLPNLLFSSTRTKAFVTRSIFKREVKKGRRLNSYKTKNKRVEYYFQNKRVDAKEYLDTRESAEIANAKTKRKMEGAKETEDRPRLKEQAVEKEKVSTSCNTIS